jgi:hypothetical protein
MEWLVPYNVDDPAPNTTAEPPARAAYRRPELPSPVVWLKGLMLRCIRTAAAAAKGLQ